MTRVIIHIYATIVFIWAMRTSYKEGIIAAYHHQDRNILDALYYIRMSYIQHVYSNHQLKLINRRFPKS